MIETTPPNPDHTADIQRRIAEASQSSQLNRDRGIPDLDAVPVNLTDHARQQQRVAKAVSHKNKWFFALGFIGAFIAGVFIGVFLVTFKTPDNQASLQSSVSVLSKQVDNLSQTVFEMKTELTAGQAQSASFIVDSLKEPGLDRETFEGLQYELVGDGNVREGPQTTFDVITSLSKGTKVVVTGVDDDQGWFMVIGVFNDKGTEVTRFPGGVTGYMGPSLLRVVQ